MSGRILLDGQDISPMTPAKRGIALVPQNLALYPDKTVLDNIAFPLTARGLSKHNARLRAFDMGEWLGLSSVLHSRPAEISGGQQQRVAIGRALIGEPRLVLLDEPLASLDALSKDEVLMFISRVLRERQTSAIYVTHDPYEANILCDVVAFIHDHRVHQVTAPGDAYNAPKTLFIARMFSGFSSVIAGILEASGRFVPTSGSGAWNLASIVRQESFGDPASILLAGRPGAFKVAPAGIEGVSGLVTGRFSLEGRSYLRVQVAPRSTLSCVNNDSIDMGSSVTIQLTANSDDELRLFDEEGNSREHPTHSPLRSKGRA
jgi:ABC-type sugar transport system ATPase subunit